MTTFKVTGSTNGYIAARDMQFNGRTEIQIETGLSYEKAREVLVKCLNRDYDFLDYCSNENEFLKAWLGGRLWEMASEVNMTEEEYFESHKKQIKVLHENTADKMWEQYDGPGYYERSGGYFKSVLLDSSDSYQFDSRYYRIEEEN